MPISKKQKQAILGGLALVSCILALVLLPSSNNLNAAKEQLASTDKKVSKQQEGKEKSVENLDNLEAEERTAQERLKQAFEQVYGGIQSKEELEKNKEQIKKVLGSALAADVWEDTYSEYGDKFFVKQNIDTQVGFQTGAGKTREVLVMVTYKFEAPQEYTKLFNLRYDLEKQQVNSYTDVSLRVNRGGGK